MLRWLLMTWTCLTFVAGPAALALAQQGEDDGGKPASGEEATGEEAAAGEEAGAQDGDMPPVEDLPWAESWDTGFALYREGAYADAIPYLQRALKLEPDDPTVRAYLAECYRQTGDEEAAARYAVSVEGEAETETEADGRPTESEEDVVVEVEAGDGHHCDKSGCGGSCCRRKLGFGLVLAGNALTVGGYVEGRPLRFLAIEGGLGVGDGHTFFWWAQAAVLPVNGRLNLSIGAGVLGNGGLDYQYSGGQPGGWVEYYIPRVNPYIHLGLGFVTRVGLSFGLDINGLITFDSSVPVAPVVGFRLGMLL